MKNEIEKKEYVAPQMTVVKMDCVATPLCCSGYGCNSEFEEGDPMD